MMTDIRDENALTRSEEAACRVLGIEPRDARNLMMASKRRQARITLVPEGAVGLFMVVYADGRASLDVQCGTVTDSLFNLAPLDRVLSRDLPMALVETRQYLGLAPAADAQASTVTR